MKVERGYRIHLDTKEQAASTELINRLSKTLVDFMEENNETSPGVYIVAMESFYGAWKEVERARGWLTGNAQEMKDGIEH